MPAPLRTRLSVMMFLHYFIVGAWAVVLATYLLTGAAEGGLHFSAGQVAWVYATLAIAGTVAPALLGLLADRLFAAEKLMGVLYLAGGGLMAAAGMWCAARQPVIAAAHAAGDARAAVDETFRPLFVLLLLYAFVVLVTGPLAGVVSLRNLPDPQRMFAGVRLYGTLGWIAAGFIVAGLLDPVSPQPMYLAAAASLLTGVYVFAAVPHTPPAGGAGSLAEALGLTALRMLRDRSFAVFLACAAGLAVVQQFYTLYANKFLHDLGAPWPAAVQTLAQWAEIGCMLLFPWALERFGIRGMLLLGLLGWCARNALFATGSLPLVVLVALPLHGLCFSFFFIVAVQYVDREAPPDLRASAQGILAVAVWGAGTLLGNWGAAVVKDRHTLGHETDWTAVWLAPFFGSVLITAVFALLFRPGRPALPPAAGPGEKELPPP